MPYRPGDFWRICERTGFKVLASRTSKEWTGEIVRDLSWEARHPQDMVRGRADNQTVPDPRPPGRDVFQGGAITSLTAEAAPGTYLLTVDDATGFTGDDLIRVMLDNGEAVQVNIFAISGNTLSLFTPLPGLALTGATVSYVQAGTPWINLDFSQTFNSHWA